MSDETAGWFDDANREGSPSAKFKDIGDSVVGEIVDKYLIDYVPFGKKEPEVDERTGNVVKQLAVVLQTELRNWEGVSKVPTDQDGNKKPESADTGRRAVYARKGTNIYSALGRALKDAEAKDLEVGGRFGIQLFEEEDTGKGNPLKKFRAKYTKPVAKAKDDGWFDEGAADESRTSEPQKAAKTLADEEPPF